MATLFDEIVRHQIQLERAKAGEGTNIFNISKDIDSDIKRILDRLPEMYTQRQLNAALKRIEKLVNNYYSRTVLPLLESSAATAVDVEVDFSKGVVATHLADEPNLAISPSKTKVLRQVNTKVYQGKKLSTWAKMLGRQKVKDVTVMVRTRAVENAPKSKLISGVSGATKRSNNAAKKVSDAYINQSVNFSRNAVYNVNEAWVSELVWSTILDGRTTITCGVRSNQRYDEKTKRPINHDNQWNGGPGVIHWNCRSVSIPTRKDGKTKVDGRLVSWKEGDKTAIGAAKGYERGDNRKKDGKKFEIPTANNKLKIDVVRASTDYEVWLKRQPNAFVRDTLGTTKAELFLNKGASLGSFVVENGRQLTIKEISKRTG